MKRWIKRTLLGAFGAAIALGGLSACSHGTWRHGGSEADMAQMRERMLDRASQKLTLDEAQKQRLGVLLDTLRAQRKSLMGAGDPRSEFQALLAGPRLDRSAAQALVEGKTTAIREGSPQVIAAAGDFYDSLRPEQQQQLRDMLARRGGWRRS